MSDDNGIVGGDQDIAENASGTVSGTFTISADAGLQSISVDGNTITQAQLLALEAGTGTIAPITTTEESGTLTITGYNSGTGVVSYSYAVEGTAKTHNAANDNVVDRIAITVTDDLNATSAADSLDILITDTAPSAVADTRTVGEDETGIIGNVVTGVNANADTLGADAATVTGVATGAVAAATEITTGVAGGGIAGTYGTLIIGTDGGYSYVTNAAAQALNDTDSETDTFSYTLKDSDGDFSTVTVTFTVAGSNDAPTVTPNTYTVTEGEITTGNVITDDTGAGVDSDPEGDSINAIEFAATNPGTGNAGTAVNGTATITTALGGTVLLLADGSYTYTAPASVNNPDVDNNGVNEAVIDSFVYKATDGTNDSDWATVTINVEDTEPVALDDTDSVGYGGTAFGNVITGDATDDVAPVDGVGDGADTLGADDASLTAVSYTNPATNVTSNYDTLSAQFTTGADAATSYWTVPAETGTLVIYQDGNYSFTSNQSINTFNVNASGDTGGNWLAEGISHYGFSSGDTSLFVSGDSLNGLLTGSLTVAAASNVADDSNGLGIAGAGIDRIQVNEHLVLELDGEPLSVSVQFDSLRSSEAAEWIAYAADGSYLSTGSFSGNSTEAVTGQINVGVPFKYLVFTGIDSGDYFVVDGLSYTYSETPPVAADEVFGYTLEDSDGSYDDAILTIRHDSEVNSIDDSGTVYESGLAGGTDSGVASVIQVGNLLDNDSGIGSSASISSIAGVDVNGAVTDSSPDGNGVLSISTSYGDLTVYTEDYAGHRAGDYEYQLVNNSLDGDSAFDAIDYTVSDGSTSDVGTLTINIVDDAPQGSPVTENLNAVAEPNIINLILTLDTSGSMGDDFYNNGLYYLEIAVNALKALIAEADDVGNVNVQIVDFAAGANSSGWYYDDVHSAFDYLDGLVAGGQTYYDDALIEVIGSGTIPPADQTLMYFVSDGAPTGDHTVDSSVVYGGQNGVAAWEAYVAANIDVAYGIGIGSGSVNLSHLQDVAYPNTDDNGDGVDDYAFILSNPNDLATSLLETLADNIVVGELGLLGTASSTGFMIGADDGIIVNIAIDGTTYTLADADGSGELTIPPTLLGGEFSFNFVSGAYTYEINLNANMLGEQEVFNVLVEDLDGDQFTVDLVINIDYEVGVDANRDILITNIADGNVVEIPALALLWNDGRGDSNNAVISSVTNVSADLSITGTDPVELTVTSASQADDGFDYTIESGTGPSVVDDTTSVTVETVSGSTITGSDKDEILLGNDAGSTLVGGAGDDVLIGGAGVDLLDGGDGSDLLIGGAGNDTMTGGSGSDEFLWIADGYDASNPKEDIITDFTLGAGGDVLNLGDLLPDGLAAEDLTEYLTFTADAVDGHTVLTVDADGIGGTTAGLVVDISNVAYTDIQNLGVDDTAIFQRLLDDGNLNVD